MITFSWKNIELSCHHSMYGKNNVAFAATAILVATDSNGNTKEKQLTVGLGVPGNNFINESDITKEDAINWIENALGTLLDSEKNILESQLTTFKLIRFE